MLDVLEAIDSWLLVMTQGVLGWLLDWLSWQQKWIERGIILAYGACAIGSVWGSRWIAVWLVGIGFCVGFMVLNHRRTNAERLANVMSYNGAVSRLILTLVLVFATGSDVLERKWLDAGVGVIWVAAEYVMALPSGGEGGKRRKAAIARIVDQFGREYVPEGA